VPTHPLWNPFETPSEEDINAARAKLGVWVPTPVEVVAPHPAWPRWYAAARDRVVATLGERVLAIEHVGSTSVPGLWAKPMTGVGGAPLPPGAGPARQPARLLTRSA
jgi:hypothetical protein